MASTHPLYFSVVRDVDNHTLTLSETQEPQSALPFLETLNATIGRFPKIEKRESLEAKSLKEIVNEITDRYEKKYEAALGSGILGRIKRLWDRILYFLWIKTERQRVQELSKTIIEQLSCPLPPTDISITRGADMGKVYNDKKFAFHKNLKTAEGKALSISPEDVYIPISATESIGANFLKRRFEGQNKQLYLPLSFLKTHDKEIRCQIDERIVVLKGVRKALSPKEIDSKNFKGDLELAEEYYRNFVWEKSLFKEDIAPSNMTVDEIFRTQLRTISGLERYSIVPDSDVPDENGFILGNIVLKSKDASLKVRWVEPGFIRGSVTKDSKGNITKESTGYFPCPTAILDPDNDQYYYILLEISAMNNLNEIGFYIEKTPHSDFKTFYFTIPRVEREPDINAINRVLKQNAQSSKEEDSSTQEQAAKKQSNILVKRVDKGPQEGKDIVRHFGFHKSRYENMDLTKMRACFKGGQLQIAIPKLKKTAAQESSKAEEN